jgi:hypothetical protein
MVLFAYVAFFDAIIFKSVLPHQVDGDADEGDEDAADADHGQHPVVQLIVVWKQGE